MLPVVQRGVEWKLLALSRRHTFPDRHEVSRVEDAVDLCVDAVKLNQVEAAFQPLALFVELVREVGDARPGTENIVEPARFRRFDAAPPRWAAWPATSLGTVAQPIAG